MGRSASDYLGKLCIARYLYIPAVLPILLCFTSSGIPNPGGIIIIGPRPSEIIAMAAFGLAGGLAIRGIIALAHKKFVDKPANYAAIAIGVIMLALSL